MRRLDPYPSRAEGPGGVQPRRDPVVHATGADREKGPLGGDLLEAYERRGFLALDSMLSGDEVEALIDRALGICHERRADPSPKVVREPDHDEIRSVFAVHEDDEVFRSVVHHPRLLGLARQILGGPVYIHQSRINYKPAFRGQPFHWHSDFETWHAEDGMPRMRAFSVSLSLTENRADNGPLMVIPESHRSYVPCIGATPEAHYERSLQRQEAGVPPEPIVEAMARTCGIESPVGPRGSATVFDCNLLHGSNGNITPFPRSNLFLVFNSADNALERPFSGQAPRPSYIASVDPTPLS